MRIMRLFSAMAVAVLLTQPSEAGKPGLPRTLPQQLETAIALSGAPKHLRDGATVYRLGDDGYVLSRQGSNGITCLVVRGPGSGPPSWDEMISSWCFDGYSMETVGKTLMDRARYVRQGLDPKEIRERINAGFASGEYTTPTRTGVIYMLSPINKVPDHRTGKLFDYLPHVMYLAPNTTNDAIGVPEAVHTGDPDYVWSGLPFLPRVGPHGFIVQPLGEKEVQAIVEEHRDLIEEVRRYVDLDVGWAADAAAAAHRHD